MPLLTLLHNILTTTYGLLNKVHHIIFKFLVNVYCFSRSITLHHRIRDNENNEYSQDIKAFDERIRKREITEDQEKEIEE